MKVWINFKDFQKLIIQIWAQIGNYTILIQPLFQLFKSKLGILNPKHIDDFLKVNIIFM